MSTFDRRRWVLEACLGVPSGPHRVCAVVIWLALCGGCGARTDLRVEALDDTGASTDSVDARGDSLDVGPPPDLVDTIDVRDVPVLPDIEDVPLPIMRLTTSVQQGSDDALQDPDGTVLVDYPWVSLYSPQHRGGLRFVLQGVPRATPLIDAYFELFIDSTMEDDPSLSIFREATSAPPAFRSMNGDITRRVLAAPLVAWRATSLGMGWARSPSLVSILQPLIDSPQYAPGQAVVFVLAPDAMTGGTRVLEFRQFEHAGGFAPRLVIEFRAPR